MRAIAPRTGAPEFTIAEEQEEFQPITIALYAYNDGVRGILTRWQLTPEDRAAIAAGEDVYVCQLSHFGNPMVPMTVLVGPGDFKIE